MKSLTKVLVGFGVFLATVFINVGYASLSEQLALQMQIGADIPKALFIKNVQVTNGNIALASYSDMTITNQLDLGDDLTSTASMAVTVYNNTDIVYGYNVYKYVMNAYDNVDIVLNVDIAKRTAVQPYETFTFNVTFSYKEGLNMVTNSVLNGTVIYEFLPINEIPEEEVVAVDGALDRFEEILATPETFNELANQMNETGGGGWFGGRDPTYISNVNGAPAADQEVINDLFAGNLHVNINGSEKEVKVFVKRKNIDNNEITGVSYVDDGNTYVGAEMTIYLTEDPLTDRGGKAVVYASVYTWLDLNRNGEMDDDWIQLGEDGKLFVGTATIVSYSGWSGTGSFNTDTWVSTESGTNGYEIEEVIEPYHLDLSQYA